MATPLPDWVVCPQGEGVRENRKPSFPKNSVGLVEWTSQGIARVWLIGKDEEWDIPIEEVEQIDVTKTGDKFAQKICNVCHRLLSVEHFSKNQRNKHGVIRRPSCNRCRTDIDKRAPKSSQAKQKEKERPEKGTPFKCPICQKRSIVGITAKIVADHDHHTGNIRDFICDSCNTGLGRFKNGKNVLIDALHYLEERDTLGH